MVLSMERWVGKVAVVTGASSGIGAAIAQMLVENGVIVVGLARRSEEIEKLAKTLSGKKGKLYAVKADLSKEEDIKNAFKWASKNVGPVQILVNNAGIHDKSSLIDGDTDKWRNTININVVALCIATREAIKIMRDNKIEGHIIHINSVAGHKVPSLISVDVYSPSKYAVTALTETLRLEINALKLKVKITSISPGVVDTPIFDEEFRKNEMVKDLLANRSLKPEDISDAAQYALSTPPSVQVHELTIKPLHERE
ncbi:unnamed protein product [Phaedon cochleariae]|uniref:Farnesol dehydrogenase-like n=1 Tax=Phaedon cochleariae TaxID=80249 RepID=A0A9P0DF29_PHACE|nr:unnamed protein product [Phaedon cochleariae]